MIYYCFIVITNIIIIIDAINDIIFLLLLL